MAKLGVTVIAMQKCILRSELAKNGILLVLLNAINDVKDGCFGAVFMVTQRALVFFESSGDQVKRNHIERELYLLLMDGYKSTTEGNGQCLYRIERLLTPQEVLFKIFKREELTVLNGLHSLLI